jgi:hypothetical protein
MVSGARLITGSQKVILSFKNPWSVRKISPKNILAPPGSGIRENLILDPGGKKARNPGSGSATLQFIKFLKYFNLFSVRGYLCRADHWFKTMLIN